MIFVTIFKLFSRFFDKSSSFDYKNDEISTLTYTLTGLATFYPLTSYNK